MTFTGMKKGHRVFIHTASNPNTALTLASDATASVITVTGAVIDEAGANGDIYHGFGLWHRGYISYLQKTSIAVYLSAENAADRNQHLECTSSTAGDNASISTDATVLAANNNIGVAVPAADLISFTAIVQPATIWNGRTTFSSVARIIVEQINY